MAEKSKRFLSSGCSTSKAAAEKRESKQPNSCIVENWSASRVPSELPVPLSIATVERIAARETEDWQRRVNQGVLKNDLNQSVSALGAMDAIRKFSYELTLEISREFEARLKVEMRMHRRKPAKLLPLHAKSR